MQQMRQPGPAAVAAGSGMAPTVAPVIVPAALPAAASGRTAPRPHPAAASDRLGSTLARLLFRSTLYRRMVLDGAVPAEVLRPFPWHTPGDRAQAEAILRDEFTFFGRRVGFGAVPWSVLPPGASLAAALHGFAWLPDLKAVGSEEARVRARALVLGWIAAHRRWSALAWSPAVLGERLAAWLAAGDFLLAGADGDERARFLESAGRQARHLARINARGKGGGDDGFAAATGEIAAALCLGVVPLQPALDRLQRALGRQLAADGGHVSRNPAVHLQAFRRLVDIRAALVEAGEPVPAPLAAAIEQMAPLLRALRHGDGRLALFHGAKESDRTLIDSLLAASRIGAPALASAPASGFERLAAGRTVLLADVGPPPPHGHQAPLAFELSCGRERLIVNCGAHGGDDPRWRAALASTPAHSTLTVEDARVGGARWFGARPVRVECVRQEADGALWLEASHDGYRPRFGVLHRRRLYLAHAGSDLRGEDTLEGRRGRAFQLRFHLHPDVQATAAADGTSVALRLASGAQWTFVAVGGQITVEDSTYLGTTDQPRRAQQIVVSGRTAKGGARVKWALRQGDGS